MLQVVNAIAYKGTPAEHPETKEKFWELKVGAPWDVESLNVVKFVQESNKKIGGSGKEYSTFKTTPSLLDFPSRLKRHLDGALSFDDFHSAYAEKKLAPSLKSSRLEEGAVIVFVHYKTYEDPIVVVGEEEPEINFDDLEPKSDQFLVLMVRNTGALKFTDDLQIAETDVIDLKQFVQGCQIDLMRFKDKYGVEIDNFLTFYKGGAEIRDYFKDALFAESAITNKASSENVEKALNAFWQEHKEEIDDRTIRDQINSNVYTFSEENKGRVITLKQISDIVDGCIPDSTPELRGQFSTFANESQFEINDEFELKSNIIKNLVYVDLDVGFAKLVLLKQSIGSTEDEDSRQVKFNAETGEVTFTTTIDDPKQLKKITSILEHG
ncbi:nucleoid-associated protein [Vibrio splendidus]|uniref:nucleoid-associated protein n=1 Tax=Vibrio splendidus TaxID=29497 RepID=UPI000D39CBE0|nr:nucleoid-associated protein [Vibrio splendidus]PTO96443.1 hypothetical protein CWN88_22605 [Vibrio splendidus]PTP94121.1 hypothetical protein CWO34_22545 [Vibrio splendidus]